MRAHNLTAVDRFQAHFRFLPCAVVSTASSQKPALTNVRACSVGRSPMFEACATERWPPRKLWRRTARRFSAHHDLPVHHVCERYSARHRVLVVSRSVAVLYIERSAI